MVQLARSIKPRTLRHRLVFVLFDGEESPGDAPDAAFERLGLRGSKVAARTLDHARAMILLDFVADKDLRIPREANSDAQLWARLRAAARRVGAVTRVPGRRAGRPISDDHVPFLRRGVRSIDLIDFDFPCWHRGCDDLSAVSERSLDASGRDRLRAAALVLSHASLGADGERERTGEAPARRAARLLRGRRSRRADRRARARALRPARLRAQGDRAQQARRRGADRARRDLRRPGDRGAGGPDRDLLRPRRLAGGARQRRRAPAEDDRRDLPARDQGPRRGEEVRRRGLHDRADRPRGPRGGRGHDGRGARQLRADRDRGGRRPARAARSRPRRLPDPDDALGRRDRPADQAPARALPERHRAQERRHLLRHHQPPARRAPDGASSATSCW